MGSFEEQRELAFRAGDSPCCPDTAVEHDSFSMLPFSGSKVTEAQGSKCDLPKAAGTSRTGLFTLKTN